MIKRSHFAPAPQPATVTSAADVAGVLREVERLTPEPRRPDEFIQRKQQIVRALRRLVAAQRYGGSTR